MCSKGGGNFFDWSRPDTDAAMLSPPPFATASAAVGHTGRRGNERLHSFERDPAAGHHWHHCISPKTTLSMTQLRGQVGNLTPSVPISADGEGDEEPAGDTPFESSEEAAHLPHTMGHCSTSGRPHGLLDSQRQFAPSLAGGSLHSIGPAPRPSRPIQTH